MVNEQNENTVCYEYMFALFCMNSYINYPGHICLQYIVTSAVTMSHKNLI